MNQPNTTEISLLDKLFGRDEWFEFLFKIETDEDYIELGFFFDEDE